MCAGTPILRKPVARTCVTMTGVSQHQGVRNSYALHYIRMLLRRTALQDGGDIWNLGVADNSACRGAARFFVIPSLDFCPIFRKSGHYAD